MNLLTAQENSASQPIHGLVYIPDYISESYAKKLIHTVDEHYWSNALKRRVQHYGYRYDYKARNVTDGAKIGDVPEWLLTLGHQLNIDSFFPAIPDQVIINEYLPGQGIAPHIDCISCFGSVIASLSLHSACVMDFVHSKTKERKSLLLDPCSLLVLSGDARYLWQHGIAHRKSDQFNGMAIQRQRRVSLTFRTMNN